MKPVNFESAIKTLLVLEHAKRLMQPEATYIFDLWSKHRTIIGNGSSWVKLLHMPNLQFKTGFNTVDISTTYTKFHLINGEYMKMNLLRIYYI